MSASTPKPLSENSSVGPSFSYAQAAKGRSPAVPLTPTFKKVPSEPADVSVRKTSVSDSKITNVDPIKVPAEEQAGIDQEEGEEKPGAESSSAPSGSTDLSTDTVVAQPRPQSEVQPQATASIPSSPSFGTASMSTLPKEDEPLSAANGSSDSTWDKQSQGSQAGVKSGEKVEGEKEVNTASTWDEEPSTSTSFKEAPLPAVNIWQHRREMQSAKAKTMQSASFNTLKLGGNTSTNNLSKNPDNPLDLRKQDNKKKAKNIPGLVEEKSGSAGSKDGNKTVEAKSRGGEEGELEFFFFFFCFSTKQYLTESKQ